jgi:hypothetical protein
MTEEATMNPITQRHRMWARTSGPDRQAERPAHHRRQRQKHRTRTALAGARILWHGGHHRGLARQFVASVGGARHPHAALPASTGIFDGARGTGHVSVDVATHQETLSGTLILIPQAG